MTRRRSAATTARKLGAARRRLLLTGLLGAACIVSLRVVQLTALQSGLWEDKAAAQHVEVMELPAPRGTIYDRAGVPLAASRESYQVAVAPREVRPTERDSLVELLRRNAGASAAKARQAVDVDRQWVVIPGRHDEAVRNALGGIRGVYVEPVLQRFYPHAGLAAHMLGSVGYDGEAQSGLELEFDSILVGRSGAATVRRGPSGRPIPGLMLRTAEPMPGRDLVLTIDQGLQQIADDALREALVSTRASGGEILLTDPHTGEVLAAASYKEGRPATNWSAITVPYEPGSTLKPFTVAALLTDGHATLADSLYGEDGRWRVAGRVLTDVHAFGWMTLEDALRESSNIGIAKAAARMDRATQYRFLRDFGFGTPSGVAYPSESGGRLRRTRLWSKQSPASLAIGYEISATPLQLAMAYGAIANGGVLMEPRIVKAVRARDGRVLRSIPARPVRRVIPGHVSDEIRRVLADVVETGTGRAASMGPLKVAGKTGTARVAVAGRYVPGAYDATFAGFFPAEEPQLVFIVKVERPKGAYYGGATAAPVTRATLEAALAARSGPLARNAMAKDAVGSAAAGDVTLATGADRAAAQIPTTSPFIFTLGSEVVAAIGPTVPRADRTVPEVVGLPLRDAVRLLHAAGLSVRVDGTGRVATASPAPGSAVKGDSPVRLTAKAVRR